MQRRHQKVLEESPSPVVDPGLRQRMGDAAVRLAKSVGYRNAGTVEFLVDETGEFYFLEVNTRLQVEHPVTECVTGLDLVHLQLRLAAGAKLADLLPDGVPAPRGHAIEARIYAEIPEQGFLPAAGTLTKVLEPEGPGIRVDSGVHGGAEVTVHYDPMLAKLIVWDRDRDGACRRLLQALQQTQLTGLTSNLDFLVTLAANEDFRRGNYDTGFIARNRDRLIVKPDLDGNVLCLAALHTLTERMEQAAAQARVSADPYSPWQVCDGWRLNDTGHEDLSFSFDGVEHDVVVRYLKAGFEIIADGRSYQAEAYREEDGGLVATLDGLRTRASVLPDNGELLIVTPDRSVRLGLIDPMQSAGDIEAGVDTVTAPMPGKIVQVLVQEGDVVERNQALVVLEAMKMEHTLLAPGAGTIGIVHHAVDDAVEEGWELLHFEPS